MIDGKLIQMLRCPVDRSQLAIAAPELIERLNDALQRGELRDRADQRVDRPLESGLLTADEKWLYPIRGGIVTLVADQAIAVG